MRARRLLALLLIVVPAVALAQPKGIVARMAADPFQLPAPSTLAEPLKLWATAYHVYPARAQAQGIKLKDKAGMEISPPLSEKDFCSASIQGNVHVTDDEGGAALYTYTVPGDEPQADCSAYLTKKKGAWVERVGRSRFARDPAPYGTGAANVYLVPFRSIAVDKSLIPFGTVLYIPAARGLAFPGISGKRLVHDGFFYAVDTGGAIKGPHIDVFSGRLQRNPFPSFIKSTRKALFDAHVVDDAAVQEHMKKLHSTEAS